MIEYEDFLYQREQPISRTPVPGPGIGATVITELVDLIQTRDGHIGSYTEFFVPR